MKFRERIASLGWHRRPAYAYGIARAVEEARTYGYREITVCEFGVARGNGLEQMVSLAKRLGDGITIRTVGFDNASGLPKLIDYRDHPEIWRSGEFRGDRNQLERKFQGRAHLIFGDIVDTVGKVGDILRSSPLAFMSVDTDFYTSAVSALSILDYEADFFLPAVSIYFDDTVMFTANRWCGELAAIEHFNESRSVRKIDIDRTLPRMLCRPGTWQRGMHVGHILDHPKRQP